MTKPMTEIEIVNNGLNWVRGFDEFTISGNHYIPYPNILKQLLSNYEVKTEYFGPSDQGSTVTTFNKRKELKPVFVTVYPNSQYPVEVYNDKIRIKCNGSENHKDNLIIRADELEEIYQAYKSLNN